MKELIRNELNFPIPEGFTVLSQEELAAYQSIIPPEWGIRNTEKHIIIVAASRRIPLLGRLVSLKDAIRKLDENLTKLMAAYDYQTIGFENCDLGGITGEQLFYTYTAQNTAMAGTSIIVRHDKNIWYIHAYFHQEDSAENKELLKEIGKEMTWQ